MAGETGSLRSRLLWSGVAGIVLAAVAVAAILGAAFERALLGSFDRRLTDDLLTVAGQVTADGGDEARMRGEPLDTRYARVFSGHYWVVNSAGREFHSRSLWDATLPAARESAVETGATAFATISGPLGQTLRMASRSIRLPGVASTVSLRVASDVSATLSDIARFRLMAGLAGALVAAALLLVLVLQAAYGLRPLGEIAQALGALRSGKARKLDADRFPREIRPLADELNAVLVHHQRMVERARTGAGDLAHALKTPLSVMLAAAERGDPELARVVDEQVLRIRHDVDRHLAVSTPADRQSRTKVAEVTASLVSLLSAVYVERRIVFKVEADDALVFRGDRADLEDMLGNILDNASKWAREQVAVTVGLYDDQLLISVTDDGPGIPGSDFDVVLRRGTRLDQGTPGSGLGLSIAAALATSYGGELSLRRAEPTGLLAVLRLPGAIVSEREKETGTRGDRSPVPSTTARQE
jgi:signal transduction histidine kinase